MSIRKIIDPKHNGEKVWLKGHAQAIYMSDGSTVEDAINDMKAEDGGITTELDPIFSASPAAKITDDNISSWNNKVDKVDGKQLSTEDFTTALMNKLSSLNNYDDTVINQAIQSLQTQLNTLVSGNASSAVESFNEIIAFLEGIEDSQSLDSIIASIEQQIAGKMNKVTLAAVATSGNYDDLSNKPTIPNAVTESTVSGWGFTKNTGTYSKPSTGIPKSDLASDVQTSLGKAETALQSHQDISGKQDNLVSGTNIKTINGESILGEGNLTVTTEANVQAVDTTDEIEDVETNTYVKYVALTLTEELKALVRENIGVNNQGTVDLSNYYTKEEIDSLLGDINTILESIINGNANNLITFTANSNEYQAEEGMTWLEFINSKYNDGAFTDSADLIYYNNSRLLLYGSYLTTAEIIGANTSYSTTPSSGGSPN